MLWRSSSFLHPSWSSLLIPLLRWQLFPFLHFPLHHSFPFSFKPTCRNGKENNCTTIWNINNNGNNKESTLTSPPVPTSKASSPRRSSPPPFNLLCRRHVAQFLAREGQDRNWQWKERSSIRLPTELVCMNNLQLKPSEVWSDNFSKVLEKCRRWWSWGVDGCQIVF